VLGEHATIVHMGQFFIVLAGALVVGAVVFGVTVLIMGGDRGLEPVEPDGRAVPLPGVRPLTEADLAELRFDVAFRGYRMAQVDQALRRAAYDLGYKEELIGVLEAEVEALRAGNLGEADTLRAAREAAARPAGGAGGESPDDAHPEGDPSGGAATGGPADDGTDGAPADGAADDRARHRAARGGEPPVIDLGLVGDPTAVEPAK
jgi:DivIVA domain-containing protein